MAAQALTANSLTGQLQQLSQTFKSVKKSADAFQQHEEKSVQLLHVALGEIFTFGEALLSMAAPAGRNPVAEFIQEEGEIYGAVARNNPYTALVKMAFKDPDESTTLRSASSRSQYATVLLFASERKVRPSGFGAWLGQGGIKGRLDEAMEALQRTQRLKNNRNRASKLAQAAQALLARPQSAAVALPSGVRAPEGFAIVLARVDGQNQAAIIDVLDGESQGLESVLLNYLGAPALASMLVERPLGQLRRALSLVLAFSPPKSRDVLVENRRERGVDVCVVQAISQEYDFPWAQVTLAGHQGDLPTGTAFVLSGADAQAFVDGFADHGDWHLSGTGELNAVEFERTLQAEPLADEHSFRVGDVSTNRSKSVVLAQAEQTSILAYIEREREAMERRNKGPQKQKKAFPTSLRMEVRSGELHLTLTGSLLSVVAGPATPDRPLDDRLLGVSDVEALLRSMAPHEADMQGWFVDQAGMKDVAIAFEATLEDDKVTFLLPTKSGSAYNQCCKPL